MRREIVRELRPTVLPMLRLSASSSESYASRLSPPLALWCDAFRPMPYNEASGERSGDMRAASGRMASACAARMTVGDMSGDGSGENSSGVLRPEAEGMCTLSGGGMRITPAATAGEVVALAEEPSDDEPKDFEATRRSVLPAPTARTPGLAMGVALAGGVPGLLALLALAAACTCDGLAKSSLLRPLAEARDIVLSALGSAMPARLTRRPSLGGEL